MLSSHELERIQSIQDLKFLEYDHVEKVMKPNHSFQRECVFFGVKRPRIVVALDKGLGKTRVALQIALNLGASRIAIMCSKNATLTWRNEIRKWWPEMLPYFQRVDARVAAGGRVYNYSAGERAQIWRRAMDADNIITCGTFATHIADYGLRTYKGQLVDGNMPAGLLEEMDLIITDEFHKFMRRRDSKTHQLLGKISDMDFARIVQETGSPVSRDPSDLWPALNVCDRKLWGSYWRYVKTYCEVSETGFGKKVEGPKLKTIPGWRQSIAPYVFRRTKEDADVVGTIPKKNRSILPVEMDSKTAEIYYYMEENYMLELEKLARDDRLELVEEGFNPEEQQPKGEAFQQAWDVLFFANSLQLMYGLRLMAICPKAVHPDLPYGSGIEAIVDEFNEEEKMMHGVVFTPFKKPIPYLKEYIEKHTEMPCYVLQGGVSPDEREMLIDKWRKTGGFVLATVAYSQSFELIEASTSWHLGYDPDGEANKQAEDRLNRLSSPAPTFHRYIMMKGTRDEVMLHNLITSGMNVRLMFGVKENLHILKEQIEL